MLGVLQIWRQQPDCRQDMEALQIGQQNQQTPSVECLWGYHALTRQVSADQRVRARVGGHQDRGVLSRSETHPSGDNQTVERSQRRLHPEIQTGEEPGGVPNVYLFLPGVTGEGRVLSPQRQKMNFYSSFLFSFFFLHSFSLH